MPRSYVKKSQYWQLRSKPGAMSPQTPAPSPVAQAVYTGPLVQAPPIDTPPAFDGNPHFTATAACGGGTVSNTQVQNSAAPTVLVTDRYPNIQAGIMPFATVEGNYSISGAIGIVYQAYFNFALLRNAINLRSDFAVGRIHVKTKNRKLKDFIETWFDAIGLNKFQRGFYLEHNRSGNTFIYKWSGRVNDTGMNMLKQSYSGLMDVAEAKTSAIIPIRYTILNPMQVYLQRGASYTYGYVRMLSTYEIERLKNPQTDEDKQVFRSFPDDIQRQIKQGGAWRWLFVPLDQNRLYYVFNRKQDYEPLAVPPTFASMNDIEFKLNLRRIDAGLVNSMEQVFMLVTTGRKADQWNQVSGAKNMQMLQDMFQNQTVGRVLVADYTTTAEWKVPDIKDLLGPAKYERVDQDIKEGLQYMFFGEDKFANASIKVRIFIESVKQDRQIFIEEFLLPEVKKVCEAMHFKNIPELEYEEIPIQDETLMNRLYVQLAQLGLLDPTETFTALKTGTLPTKDESLEHQAEYKQDRDKGLYMPMMPGGTQGAQNGRPGGSGGTPAPRQVSTPIGQKKGTAASVGTDERTDISSPSKYRFGMMKVADNLLKMNEIRSGIEDALRRKWKIKELNEAQASVATTLARNLVFNEPEVKWKESISTYAKGPRELADQSILLTLNEIAAEFEVDAWTAAVLSRSQVAPKST